MVLIAATVLASMVGFLDASVVNVAIPAIGKSLGANVATLQWTLTSYLVTVAALLMISGVLADRFGRRKILAIGLLIIAASAVICAVAPNSAILILARVIQGFGGALVIPSSIALLSGSLRPEERARGIGIWAGLSTLGSTVGPYAGGWVLDHSSWRWLFLLNIPLIILALVALRGVPKDAGTSRHKLSTDTVGITATIICLGGLIYALTQGPAQGWTNPVVLVTGFLGVSALIVLPFLERRVASPMLQLSLFKSRQFNAINICTVLFYATISGASFLLTVQCEVQLGYSAAEAGAVLIPGSIVFLLLSPVSGALVSRYGPRWLMSLGILIVGGAIIWLSVANPGVSYLQTILPATLMWGLGLGLSVTPLTAAVIAAVPDTDIAEGSAVNNLASRIGGLLAIAALPAVAGATGGRNLSDTLADGYQLAMIVAGFLSLTAAVVAVLFVTNLDANESGDPAGPLLSSSMPTT
ncbi:DHA2 family efflux MFS transporter permease subunit [Streptomyces sp. NPDC059215]|uniref:DHA2 family efflux MFS transporter permease subunit n=1 Tax=Streptomyces sp. NPDC059215 TaxID=3346772 RepID=UPI0036949DD4